MTKDDLLFGHPSPLRRGRQNKHRGGLPALRCAPPQLPKMIEERILSFSIAHPGLGPKRIAGELRRHKWGAIVVSPNGVWKVLCRHGLNTRAKRLGLVAGYAAAYEPPRDSGPERHIDVRWLGELVGIDCLYIGRLRGTEGKVWQLTDRRHLFLRVGRAGGRRAGLSDRAADLKARLRHTRIHAGRPQTNGNLKRELDTYLRFYNFDRVRHGRLTGRQIPADIVYGARKMEVR